MHNVCKTTCLLLGAGIFPVKWAVHTLVQIIIFLVEWRWQRFNRLLLYMVVMAKPVAFLLWSVALIYWWKFMIHTFKKSAAQDPAAASILHDVKTNVTRCLTCIALFQLVGLLKVRS